MKTKPTKQMRQLSEAKRVAKLHRIPTMCDMEPPVGDARGRIIPVSHIQRGSCVVIESKAGTVRAQHWHLRDDHHCYLVSGSMLYLEQEIITRGRKIVERPNEALIRGFLVQAGECVYTPPQRAHAMFFLEDTVFITLGDRHRTQADYEKDLVRLSDDEKLHPIAAVYANVADSAEVSARWQSALASFNRVAPEAASS